MADFAELEFFSDASRAVMATKAVGKKAEIVSKGNEEFIGLNPEEQKGNDEDSVGEIEKLREENKRLKKTLLEKFTGEQDQN